MFMLLLLPSAYSGDDLAPFKPGNRLITLRACFPESQQGYEQAIKDIRIHNNNRIQAGNTTLYASLARLNSPEKNIITLEDPIERRMDN